MVKGKSLRALPSRQYQRRQYPQGLTYDDTEEITQRARGAIQSKPDQGDSYD